jgi:hypothetical protein
MVMRSDSMSELDFKSVKSSQNQINSVVSQRKK